MRKVISTIVFIILSMVVMASVGAQPASADPNLPDTIRVDSIVSFTSSTGIVPVYFFNDESLAGLEIVLYHNSPSVVIDSFSFQDGRLRDVEFRGTFLNDDSSVVIINAFDSIPPGNGLVGSLYLSYSSNISPQIVSIDTTSIISGQIEITTTFSDTAFQTFVPQFVKGYLDIQDVPESLDSVILNDAVAQPGGLFSIDVGLYNENEVSDITLALDYGSDYLHYDSLSFQSSRPLPAVINSPLVQNQISSHELLLHLTFDDSSPLSPGSGLLAQLFFTVDPGAPETLIVIDTNTFAGIVHTELTTSPAAGGETFVPFFSAGSVEIGALTDVQDILDDNALPKGFALEQNYPNPFNPTTRIQFSVARAGLIQIEIYNVLGRRVRELMNTHMSAGVYEVIFDARADSGEPLASGIYFYRMVSDEFTQKRKMLLLR